MRIGFVVNDIDTEQPQYTTTRLAMTAARLGHETWVMGVGDFAHRADGSIGASARSPKAASCAASNTAASCAGPARMPTDAGLICRSRAAARRRSRG